MTSLVKQKKGTRIQNESGTVYIIVVSMILVLSVLAISVLSASSNHALLSEGEVAKIQAEELAIGLKARCELEWINSAYGLTGRQTGSFNNPISLDGRAYKWSCNLPINTFTGPNGTTPYTLSVTY